MHRDAQRFTEIYRDLQVHRDAQIFTGLALGYPTAVNGYTE